MQVYPGFLCITASCTPKEMIKEGLFNILNMADFVQCTSIYKEIEEENEARKDKWN